MRFIQSPGNIKRKLKLAKEEYKDISYSESAEMELEELCSKLAKEI
ncbi:MAG TPA: hypothetical protein GX527_12000 [Clostridiaceae bacterium]|jgi:hypothetical protein|nr:hypothetical protein [Clostridiaceae bacterium]